MNLELEIPQQDQVLELEQTEVVATRTSQLINDGDDGTHPFIDATDITGKADTTYVDAQDVITLNSAKSYTDTSVLPKADKTYVDNQLALKQDKINDLASIRAGAVLGTTSIQPNDNVSELVNDAGYLTSHQSLSAYRTSAQQDIIDNTKVDKVQGKGLSENDYTTAEKNKLSGIQNGAEVNVQSDWNQTNQSADDYIKNKPTIPSLNDYYTKTETDSAISNHHDSSKQDTLQSGTNIKTINSQSILGSGNIQIDGGVQSVNGQTGVVVLDAEDVGALPTGYHDSTKQDVISDLSTIRSGASLGTTSIQPNDNVSELTNDAGYLTSHQSLSNYYNKTETDTLLSAKQDNLPSVVNDRYLHTNSSTGVLEWSEISAGELATLTVTMVGSQGNIPTGDTVQVYVINGTTETMVGSMVYGTTPVAFRLEKNHQYKITGTITVSGFYNPTPVTMVLTTDSSATVEYYEVATPTTMSDVHNLISLGLASQVMHIGDEINVQWTATNGTTYTNPAIVMDLGQQYTRHSDGQLVDGVRFQFKYGFPDCTEFDREERELSTETTAQENVYYYGTNDNSTFTLLNYNAGDTIDYSAYTYIYHNSFRDTTTYILKYGNNLLEYSAEHQWLNSSQPAGQWWQSTHLGDSASSQANTIRGFMAGFNSSLLDYVLEEDFKVGENTETRSGALVTLHSKFRLPMLVEEYGVPQIAGEGDNKYWEGWKKFCNESIVNPLSSPSNGNCDARRIRNLENTSFSSSWLSSCSRGGSYGEWGAYNGSGNLNGYYAYISFRCAPAFVII